MALGGRDKGGATASRLFLNSRNFSRGLRIRERHARASDFEGALGLGEADSLGFHEIFRPPRPPEARGSPRLGRAGGCAALFQVTRR